MGTMNTTRITSDAEFSKGWSLRRERFCQEFVRCGNLTLAAKRAGFSAHSARKTGWDLYHTVAAVRARIEELLAAEESRPWWQKIDPLTPAAGDR